MIKKVILGILLSVFLLSIPLVSCVAPAGSSSTGGAATPIQELANRVLAIEQNYVKRDEFNAFGTRLVAVEARPAGSADSYSKSDTYTKSEVDNKITTLNTTVTNYEARIKALEDKIGTSSTTTTITTGQVSVITNPTAIQTMGNTNVCYTVKITNGTSQWCYVRPIFNVNLHTGQSPLSTPLSAATIVITAGGSPGSFVDADFQVTGTNTNAILIPTTLNGTGTGEIQVGAGVVADLLVCIQITHSDSRIWDITSTVNWRSL